MSGIFIILTLVQTAIVMVNVPFDLSEYDQSSLA